MGTMHGCTAAVESLTLNGRTTSRVSHVTVALGSKARQAALDKPCQPCNCFCSCNTHTHTHTRNTHLQMRVHGSSARRTSYTTLIRWKNLVSAAAWAKCATGLKVSPSASLASVAAARSVCFSCVSVEEREQKKRNDQSLRVKREVNLKDSETSLEKENAYLERFH